VIDVAPKALSACIVLVSGPRSGQVEAATLKFAAPAAMTAVMAGTG
jgi:hypothetical protein